MACKPELRNVLGVDTSSGKKVITGVHLPYVNCVDLRCVNLWFDNIKTPVVAGFPDGTALAPGVAFTAEPSTGMYRPGNGQVAFSGAGVNLATLSSAGLLLNAGVISTTSGDLILNPAGSNVDFSGKTLTNVGGISSDPNRYEVIGPQVTTVDATPTIIFTIPTVAAAYTALVDLAVASGTSSGSCSVRLQIKNTGVAIVNVMSQDKRFDAAIVAATLLVSATGANVNLTATGIAATVMKWKVAATVTRSLY